MPPAGYKARPRFSKVTRRMWNDEKFRGLSRPQPNGQTLWVRLLTGPESTNIPGLIAIGEAALAEALDWPKEAFREAFREVSGKGMAEADWKARLIWIPNAIEHNRPESPNVVKSWSAAWEEAPECAIKAQAWQKLDSCMEAFGEAFQEAFREACRKPSGNQEQEQEQDKEILQPTPSAPAAAPSKPKKKAKAEPTAAETDCRRAIARAFAAEYASRSGGETYRWDVDDQAAVKRWATRYGNDPDKALAALREFVRRMESDPFLAKNFRPAYIGSPKVLNALALPVLVAARRDELPGSAVPGIAETAAEDRKREEERRRAVASGERERLPAEETSRMFAEAQRKARDDLAKTLREKAAAGGAT